jgi:hypothetical protein
MPPVAEASATPPEPCTYLQNLFSNSVRLGPVVIHLERNTFATALISSSVIDGRENGQNSDLMVFALNRSGLLGITPSSMKPNPLIGMIAIISGH